MKTTILLILLVFFSRSCDPVSGGNAPEKKSVLSYPSPTPLKKAESGPYYDALNSFFEKTLFRSFNGAIVVVKNDTIVYEKYQGFGDLRKRDPVTEHTPFHIASASKPMTAMAVLQLVQENKLSLDDPISKFLPDLPYSGITIKMLLDHRSGLPNYLYFISKSDWDKSKYVTNEDVYEQLKILQPKQSFPTDKHFSYSNTNFALLALIIEKITGEPFPQYMKERFFDPLGMNDTYIFTLADSLSATPSFYTNGKLFEHDFLEATYGDKNVYTTPTDLYKWGKALMSGQIIRQTLLDSAFTPQSLEHRSVHNYGLGWRMAIFPSGKKLIYHFGRWHGFNAAFEWLADEKTMIIILGNRFTFNVYNSAHKCCSLFGDYWGKQESLDEPENAKDYREGYHRSKKTHMKALAKK